MALFECTNCGSVDNTAVGKYWGEQTPLCSACVPETVKRFGADYLPYGQWHNIFERLTVAQWVEKHPDIEIWQGNMFDKRKA